MPPTEIRSQIPWRPMSTAPETVAQVWLNHLTLGPILAEGRRGRWYAPNATRQVWRWYRSAEPDALEPFSGWLPVEALAADPGAAGTVPDRARDDRAADRSRACARNPSESPARRDRHALGRANQMDLPGHKPRSPDELQDGGSHG